MGVRVHACLGLWVCVCMDGRIGVCVCMGVCMGVWAYGTNTDLPDVFAGSLQIVIELIHTPTLQMLCGWLVS